MNVDHDADVTWRAEDSQADDVARRRHRDLRPCRALPIERRDDAVDVGTGGLVSLVMGRKFDSELAGVDEADEAPAVET